MKYMYGYILIGFCTLLFFVGCLASNYDSSRIQSISKNQFNIKEITYRIGEHVIFSTESEVVHLNLSKIDINQLDLNIDSIHYETIKVENITYDTLIPNSEILKLPVISENKTLYFIAIDSMHKSNIIGIIQTDKEFTSNFISIPYMQLIKMLSFEPINFKHPNDTVHFTLYGICDSVTIEKKDLLLIY